MTPKDESFAPNAETTRLSRRAHVTDPDAVFSELQAENDALVRQIVCLEARLPSAEELAYLRNRKAADERAAWAWKMLRIYVPWVASVVSVLGTAAYWIVTNFQPRPGPH